MTALSGRISAEPIHVGLGAIAAAFAALLIVVLPHAMPQVSRSGSGFFPGDPKAGLQIFIQKGSAHCHSLFGREVEARQPWLVLHLVVQTRQMCWRECGITRPPCGKK